MQFRAIGIIAIIAVVAILMPSGVNADPVVLPSPRPTPVPVQCTPPWVRPATSTVFLPNITRRLGGPDGFYTPFIIQNTGAVNTELEVTFYEFTLGNCVEQYRVPSLAPGASHSNNPNDDVRNTTLPNNGQFSVVVRSFQATIVGVVNQHQNTNDPDRAEAMSYNGFNKGAKTVYLPNITRRFFGLFDTPFIIQNLSGIPADVTATFKPFDGISPTLVVRRHIDSYRAKPIDPDSDDLALGAPGLTDNKQYAVTVTSTEDIAIVVNTQADKPSVAHHVAWSTNGITAGASTVYGAYAAKDNAGGGFYSPIIVQNLGSAPVSPKITFATFEDFPMGAANTYTFPPIQPNASRAFDPRFSFSTQGTSNVPCSVGGADCLADGEYTFKIEATGGSIAAQVNVSNAVTGRGYSAAASADSKLYLPNVPKGLCFCSVPNITAGWTGNIFLQNISAVNVTLRWYATATGALVHEATVPIQPGRGIRRSPWQYSELAPDREYSVVVDGAGGTINAVVWEVARGGDNSMMYEGVPAPLGLIFGGP